MGGRDEETPRVAPKASARELYRRALADAKGGKKGETWGWFFIAPAILLFLVFQFWPLLRGLLMAFSDYRALDPATHGLFRLNGLANYKEILADRDFWAAFGVTLRYTALYTPMLVALSLWVSILSRRCGTTHCRAFTVSSPTSLSSSPFRSP